MVSAMFAVWLGAGAIAGFLGGGHWGWLTLLGGFVFVNAYCHVFYTWICLPRGWVPSSWLCDLGKMQLIDGWVVPHPFAQDARLIRCHWSIPLEVIDSIELLPFIQEIIAGSQVRGIRGWLCRHIVKKRGPAEFISASF